MSERRSIGRVLHVVQDSFGDPRYRFLGSVKDTLGRVEYFESRGFPVDSIVAEERSDEKLAERLARLDLRAYRIAVFELPLYPKSLRLLRREAPSVQRWTRPINAEFLHQVHLFRAHLAHPYARDKRLEPFRDVVRSILRLRLDHACARQSDVLLSISDWETRHYWRRVAGQQRTRTLPYFLPSSYVADLPGNMEKRPLCVCVLSTAESIRPFTLDAAQRFAALVRKHQQSESEWKFAMTGSTRVHTTGRNQTQSRLLFEADIEQLGFVQDPIRVLAEARSMALLSDLGYGFKTKILDAIAARCWVLVMPGLYGRLPQEVRPYCIVVEDSKDVGSFRRALRRSMEPFPEGDPNTELRERAFKVLDELIEST